MQALRNGPSQELQTLAFNNYQSFLFWSLRSKGRGLGDILNLETEVVRTVQTSAMEAAETSRSPEKDHDKTSTEDGKSTTMELETQLKTTSIQDANKPDADLFGKIVAPVHLSNMLQNLPSGVVIVDFLEAKYAKGDSPLVAMLYRKGQMNFPTRLPGVNMADIDKWVKKNLTAKKCLYGADSTDKLKKLAYLIRPLVQTSPKLVNNPIQPGETIILCPTGSLNRVPIHAIPVDSKPLIERNPVVYTQSLSVLHWLWSKTEEHKSRTRQAPKRSLINPLPDDFPSTDRVAVLSRKLDASFHHGFDLKSGQVAETIPGSSLLHYHGHVIYNKASALDTAMILNEKAFKVLGKKQKSGWINVPAGCEVLTPRGFFKVKLESPALASIIGCGSGVTDISSTDDVLGIPTAMFYAGATSVVSTLWPIDDEDGAAFSQEFYDAIWEQKSTATGGSGSVIDLAKAMQAAVLKLRSDPVGKERSAAYHWAAFTLNGFWLLPSDVFAGLD